MTNSKFTEKAKEALDLSLEFAREMGHTYVGTEHILMGLLSVRDSTAYRLLTDRGANVKTVRDTVANTVGTGSATKVGGSEMTPMTRKIIEESAFCANRLGESKIGSEHILSAILCEND